MIEQENGGCRLDIRAVASVLLRNGSHERVT